MNKHVLKGTHLGLLRNEYPRCILWLESGFGDDDFEWLDPVNINQANEIMIEMRGLVKNEDLSTIPMINYNHIK